MKKSELREEKPESTNRLTWHQLDCLNAEDKEKLIEEHGNIFIFDGKKLEIYEIRKVEL